MNGGAWLHCGNEKVDVILRDLNTVEHWKELAENGEFERDALLGYLAGAPTYLLSAELASCRPLIGSIPSAEFPQKLITTAPSIWRFCSSFSLDYARAHARRGNVAGVMGQASTALMEESHAILCEQGQWICNEKRIIELAKLTHLNDLFLQSPSEANGLMQWIDRFAEELGASNIGNSPWK